MGKLNNRSKLIIIVATVLLFLFIGKNVSATFTANELKFVKPYSESHIAIYKSDKGQIDTIKFYKFYIDTIKYRNTEQGFYNEYDLIVRYELTEDSYHKLITVPNNKKTDNLMTFIKVKGSYETKEMGFLGLVFENKFILNAISSRVDSVLFSDKDAIYRNININKGISSFVYRKDQGIVSYSDDTGSIWKRIN